MPPKAFCAVLQTKAYSSLTEENKVSIISKYAKFHEDFSEEEKEHFAEIIDFTSEKAYEYIIKYGCDWAPVRLTRSLYSKILDIRRKVASEFEEESKTASQEIPRLFLLQWMNNVVNCIDGSGDKKLMSMINGFGGASKAFGAFKYGLLFEQATKPVQEGYEADNIFIDGKYYWGGGTACRNPQFTLSFGSRTKVLIRKITVNSKINDNGIHRLPPSCLQAFTVAEDGNEVKLSDPVKSLTGIIEFSFPEPVEANTIILKLVKKCEYEICLRINTIEIEGVIKT